MKLYVDVSKRRLRDGLNGAVIQVPRFFQGDVLNLEIVLVSGGANVSCAVLGPNLILKVSLSKNESVYAEAKHFSLADEIASLSLDLTGTALSDYLRDSHLPLTLKIELASLAGGTRETLFLGNAIVKPNLIVA